MKLYSRRAGHLYHVQSDYDCFVPNSIQDIKINYDSEMILLLAEARASLGKLDGFAHDLPDKDIFIAKYVEKEAVLSSQIEGTQASLSDVFQFDKISGEKRKETQEVVNYVAALNYGVQLLNDLPISLRYLKAVHKELLKGVRGDGKNPGEIRHSQNWIGPNGCTLLTAAFVPPSVDKMQECLFELENYINSDEVYDDALIRIALIHYQFETIHPFLDGNGRLGRLLIPLWLKEKRCLENPLLYLSLFFKMNRNEYYGLLMDVRFKGKFEEWLKFFLKGVIETAESCTKTIQNIAALVKKSEESVACNSGKNRILLLESLKLFYKHPYFDTGDLIENLGISKPTASSIVKFFLSLGMISPTSDKLRNVTYRYDEYVAILEEGTEI